jgi:hypothetical protein
MPSSSAHPDPELELASFVELSVEQRSILFWRVEVLQRSGVPLGQAWDLARSEIDLREACRLLDLGATPDQIARILL